MLWSLLYPILSMTVLTLVFRNIFRLSQPGVNFPVYVMIGLVYYNYFSEATSTGLNSVVQNFSLINKVYIPKYIFPLSKCIFVGINFLFTLIPLTGVIIFTGNAVEGTKCYVNWMYIFLPYSFMCLFLFTLGVTLILSCITVFFRDMVHIYGIVVMVWMYLTPILYDETMLGRGIQMVLKVNPLYYLIGFGRSIILYGEMPSPLIWIACAVSGLGFALLGTIVFKNNQDKFIHYV
ncbi:MAG: ABC transporter permease [Lachnospiraceae bacterium]|nr:ABC transporter permease [Lachnospiraceae bacterium]